MISSLNGTFGRIHHGFLNNLNQLRALRTHCRADGEFTEIAEGDLCWLVDGGDVELFFMHPSKLNRLPRRQEIRAGIEKGTIPTLSDILDPDLDQLKLIVELKRGYGPARPALEKLLDLL